METEDLMVVDGRYVVDTVHEVRLWDGVGEVIETVGHTLVQYAAEYASNDGFVVQSVSLGRINLAECLSQCFVIDINRFVSEKLNYL